MTDRTFYRLLIATGIALFAVCTTAGVAMSVRQSTGFYNACTAAGGRVHSYDPRTCVAPDGRIIQP